MEASRAFRPDEGSEPQLAALAEYQHSVHALVELTGALTQAGDLHGIVDALLLNLMGHLGTPRAGVWLVDAKSGGTPAPIRGHGLNRSLMTMLGGSFWTELGERLAVDTRPLRVSELGRTAGFASLSLAHHAGIELLAPLRAGSRTLGFLALGGRVGGRPYRPLDLEMVEASAAMTAMALHNADLRGEALELNRRQSVALEELAEMDRLKTQFLSNLNHELRTPVTLMIASIDCLGEVPAGSEQAGVMIEHARRGAQRLSQIVQQLLAFKDAVGKTVTVKLEEYDLATWLRSYLDTRRPGISAGHRLLEFSVATDRTHARMDEHRLRQSLDALVDNALKFTPAGTRIRVGLRGHSEADREWLRIEVADDGPGIAAELLPQIFDDFRQADGSSTREAGGLGLGLALVRRLIEAMGGRITVRSVVGEGSVFSIDLPAADAGVRPPV